jgi:Amt family ammonium transporter
MQLWIQTKAVLITAIFSFAASMILFKFVDMVATLRVSEHEERVGLDLTQHREAGYTLLD